jgi:hypothetical protein
MSGVYNTTGNINNSYGTVTINSGINGVWMTGNTGAYMNGAITTTANNSGQVWNNSTWNTITSTKINILGIECDFDWMLNNDVKIAIANLNFNGYRYWYHLKEAEYSFGEENDKKIDNQVKILSRRAKLKKIPN